MGDDHSGYTGGSARVGERGSERLQRLLVLSGVVLFVAGFGVVAGLPDVGPIDAPLGGGAETAATPTPAAGSDTAADPTGGPTAGDAPATSPGAVDVDGAGGADDGVPSTRTQEPSTPAERANRATDAATPVPITAQDPSPVGFDGDPPNEPDDADGPADAGDGEGPDPATEAPTTVTVDSDTGSVFTAVVDGIFPDDSGNGSTTTDAPSTTTAAASNGSTATPEPTTAEPTTTTSTTTTTEPATTEPTTAAPTATPEPSTAEATTTEAPTTTTSTTAAPTTTESTTTTTSTSTTSTESTASGSGTATTSAA